MNHSALNTIFERASADMGYNFINLVGATTPKQAPPLPAAILSSFSFQSREGRNRGKTTYALKFQLLQKGATLSGAERQELIEHLESDALEIMTTISTNPKVALIKELVISPLSSSKIARQECGVEVTAEIVTIF